MTWQLSGEYLENCNCEVLCPCITSSLQGPADHERCVLPLAMHITAGQYDGVSLDGLGVGDGRRLPAGDGGRRLAGGAVRGRTRRRRPAAGSEPDFSGANGGPPAMLAGLIGEQLGVKFVPMSFESSDDTKRVTVPGIMDFQVTGLRAPDSAVMRIVNIFHPMGADLAVARSTVGTYDDPDYGWSFDNTGKNGHYRDFAWQA